jgi:Flp pilus assembly protein TadD
MPIPPLRYGMTTKGSMGMTTKGAWHPEPPSPGPPSSKLCVMASHPNPPAQKLLELAARAMGAGQFAEAEEHLERVLLHDPENAVALHHLGLRAYLRGQTADARRLIERAVAAGPDNIQVLTSYGTMLHELGQPREALDVFLHILTLNNSLAEIWNGAGICLQETGQHAQAVDFYLRAMKLRPNFAEAHSNLGAVLVQEGDTDGAIEHLRQALALDPKLAVAHTNLGIALRGRFEYAAAVASLQEALRLTPGHPEVLSGLGEVLSLVYDDAAEGLLRQGAELRPHDPEKHWNLALELLKRGDYAAGFREHEWRWRRPKQKSLRRFTQPLWLGELDLHGQQIAGTTILLHAEQGFGDTLQFLRYLPAILALGARVVLSVQPPLVRLVTAFAERLQADVKVVGDGEPLPPFDWHTPLMSLPLAFGTTLDTVPPPVRFTQPAAPRPEAGTRPLRVGIMWAGNPKHDRDRERTIPTATLLPLFAVPDCSWVSLQIGPPIAELIALGVLIEQPPLRDFLDTANVIDTLDLVISVDSAVAHLAAAQGAPTWVLLPFVADWRWLRPETQTNPWYPQARLFRQRQLPDGRAQSELWAPRIAEVAAALEAISAPSALQALP